MPSLQQCSIAQSVEQKTQSALFTCSGGVTTEEMSGKTEAAFLSAIKLHVTGNLALIRAAEEELIKNKASYCRS